MSDDEGPAYETKDGAGDEPGLAAGTPVLRIGNDRDRLLNLVRRHDQVPCLRSPPCVVLFMGPQKAGKSTYVNTLNNFLNLSGDFRNTSSGQAAETRTILTLDVAKNFPRLRKILELHDLPGFSGTTGFPASLVTPPDWSWLCFPDWIWPATPVPVQCLQDVIAGHYKEEQELTQFPRWARPANLGEFGYLLRRWWKSAAKSLHCPVFVFVLSLEALASPTKAKRGKATEAVVKKMDDGSLVLTAEGKQLVNEVEDEILAYKKFARMAKGPDCTLLFVFTYTDVVGKWWSKDDDRKESMKFLKAHMETLAGEGRTSFVGLGTEEQQAIAGSDRTAAITTQSERDLDGFVRQLEEVITLERPPPSMGKFFRWFHPSIAFWSVVWVGTLLFVLSSFPVDTISGPFAPVLPYRQWMLTAAMLLAIYSFVSSYLG